MIIKRLSPILLFLAACAAEPGDEGHLTPCLVEGEIKHFDLVALSMTSCEDAAKYHELRDRAIEAAPAGDALEAIEAPAEVELPEDGIATSAHGIQNGLNVAGFPEGAVEVGGCTGILISSRAILTAAHCFDDVIAPDKNGWVTTTISNFTPNKTQRYSGSVRVNIHPDYTGDGDTGDDIAVVKLLPPDNFPGFSAAARTRIYTDTFANLEAPSLTTLLGRGFNDPAGTGSGVMRAMLFRPEWYGDEHYFLDANDPSRTCNGDSGGPLINYTPGTIADPGYRVVAGLHSSSEKNSGEKCARDGGRMRGVRLNQKITWIEDMLDVDCHSFSDDGWSYVRCW